MGPVPDGATARSAGGLPEVGQHAVFRAPDECFRWMGWKDHTHTRVVVVVEVVGEVGERAATVAVATGLRAALRQVRLFLTGKPC